MRLLISGSQVRALVRPPRKKSSFPKASRNGGREQNGSRATLFVVVRRTPGAVLWALRSNHPHAPTPDELYSTVVRLFRGGLGGELVEQTWHHHLALLTEQFFGNVLGSRPSRA
jgi:hypothetical protein